ncbi:MAG: hypothetical protein KGZ58_08765 [Ignavibacteriales bacterium]|nr:hypothetical protein [Ignavibacteriales bacterium]
MKTKLHRIYSVQQIDIRLDELEELKGDLPAEAARLHSEIDTRVQYLTALQEMITKALVEREETDTEISSAKEKIEKYRAQQMDVKTNKQYDALAKEIESSQSEILKQEKEFHTLESRASMAKIDSEKISLELPALREELQDIEEQLKEVSVENSGEEQILRAKREKLVAEIEPQDLVMYDRIRKAKNGKGIVSVLIREEGKTKKMKEGTCGGCFHRVHPERLVELRTLEKMFTCEHCGRILVPPEVTESLETILQEA